MPWYHKTNLLRTTAIGLVELAKVWGTRPHKMPPHYKMIVASTWLGQ